MQVLRAGPEILALAWQWVGMWFLYDPPSRSTPSDVSVGGRIGGRRWVTIQRPQKSSRDGRHPLRQFFQLLMLCGAQGARHIPGSHCAGFCAGAGSRPRSPPLPPQPPAIGLIRRVHRAVPQVPAQGIDVAAAFQPASREGLAQVVAPEGGGAHGPPPGGPASRPEERFKTCWRGPGLSSPKQPAGGR